MEDVRVSGDNARGELCPANLRNILVRRGGPTCATGHLGRRYFHVILEEFGGSCNFNSILDQGKQVGCKGDLRENPYIMKITTITASESVHTAVVDSFPAEGEDPPEVALIADNSGSRASIDTWHRRLAHLNTDDIVCMARKRMTRGMEIILEATPFPMAHQQDDMRLED